jgi:hypothetical protein
MNGGQYMELASDLIGFEWLEEKRPREPHELVIFEARGGTSIDGEWEFSGNYDILVPRNKIGNSYPYEGSLYPHYSRGKKRSKSGWIVTLKCVGGEYHRLSVEVLNKRAASKIQARKMIVEAIREFEQSDRYKNELWPKIIDPDKRESIIKEVNGELIWVATTWVGTWTALQGKSSWQGYDERPFGSGQFYTRKVEYEYHYPKKEDGWSDYTRGVKVYKEPSYRKYELSGYGMGSGGGLDQEIKAKIDEAIFDLDNMVQLYIMYQKYRSLKGETKYWR